MVDRQFDVDGTGQFPARDPSAKRLLKERASRTDDALTVETTERGAPRHFRRHSRENISGWTGGHEGLKVTGAPNQVASNATRVWRRRFRKDVDHGVDHEFLFGPPPAVDRRFSDPCFRRDCFDAQSFDALLDEQLEGGPSHGLVSRRAPRATRPTSAVSFRGTRWSLFGVPTHDADNMNTIPFRISLVSE